MTDDNKGLVAAGARLVWRRQSVVWWVFLVNFLIGGLGASGAARILSQALGHSLAGEQLIHRFDLGMFIELVIQPDVQLMRSSGTSVLFAFLFFLFLLFVMGGILEVYRQDRKLTTEEFFAASGAFFWRFVRLTLLSLVPFLIVGMVYGGIRALGDYIGDRVTADKTGFYIFVAGLVVTTILLLLVRVWFDIAQIRAVAQSERKMWRNTWKSLRIILRHVGTLVWMYLRISLVAWIILLIGLWIWTRLPSAAVPVTFLLLELIMLVQLAARLWQKASATIWYQVHAELVPADAVDYTTAKPEEVVEPAPYPEPAPEPPLPPLPGPETPPQEA